MRLLRIFCGDRSFCAFSKQAGTTASSKKQSRDDVLAASPFWIGVTPFKADGKIQLVGARAR
jgi:hypothetical protein